MKKNFKDYAYDIDTNNCDCGSNKIVYETYQTVRHQGASNRHVMETIINEELTDCYCPDCGKKFNFTEL